MATYANVTDTSQPTFAPPGVGSLAVVENRVALATADMTLANTIPVGRVPKGSLVHDAVVTLTDIDTGTACVVSLGDAGSPARFIQGSTAGQAATTVRAGNNATSAATFAAHTPYVEETLIYMTFATAPGTPATGTMKATVIYSIPAA